MAVVVKLERADELVMVKLLVLVDMEQLAARSLCQPGVKSVVSLSNEVHFSEPLDLSNLWSVVASSISQYAQCVFGTSGIIRMPSLVLIVNSSA